MIWYQAQIPSGIPELDALIKMPMPDEDPEEEAEEEGTPTARRRAYDWEERY